jgi:hypothetical protein
MTIRSALKLLLGFSLAMPLLQALLLWVAGLLKAMGDEAAAHVVSRVNIAAGVLWLVALVGLVLLLAIRAVNEPPSAIDELDEPPL